MVSTPVSDVETRKQMAEVVTGLGETLKALQHKLAKETGPSVVESIEVQSEEKEQIVLDPKDEPSKNPVDLPGGGGVIPPVTKELDPFKEVENQPLPQSPVKAKEYVGGSKEDLTLSETLALRSPFLGLTGSQDCVLKHLVDPQVGGLDACPWAGGPRVVTDPEDCTESDGSSDELDPQSVVIPTSGT